MKASVFIGTSVDGFIARQDGALDWLPVNGGEPHGYDEFMATVDALVIGRKTFETVLTFDAWPYGPALDHHTHTGATRERNSLVRVSAARHSARTRGHPVVSERDGAERVRDCWLALRCTCQASSGTDGSAAQFLFDSSLQVRFGVTVPSRSAHRFFND